MVKSYVAIKHNDFFSLLQRKTFEKFNFSISRFKWKRKSINLLINVRWNEWIPIYFVASVSVNIQNWIETLFIDRKYAITSIFQLKALSLKIIRFNKLVIIVWIYNITCLIHRYSYESWKFEIQSRTTHWAQNISKNYGRRFFPEYEVETLGFNNFYVCGWILHWV